MEQERVIKKYMFLCITFLKERYNISINAQKRNIVKKTGQVRVRPAQLKFRTNCRYVKFSDMVIGFIQNNLRF